MICTVIYQFLISLPRHNHKIECHVTRKNGEKRKNLSSVTAQKHWINVDVMYGLSALKGKWSVTKMSIEQR